MRLSQLVTMTAVLGLTTLPPKNDTTAWAGKTQHCIGATSDTLAHTLQWPHRPSYMDKRPDARTRETYISTLQHVYSALTASDTKEQKVMVDEKKNIVGHLTCYVPACFGGGQKTTAEQLVCLYQGSAQTPALFGLYREETARTLSVRQFIGTTIQPVARMHIGSVSSREQLRQDIFDQVRSQILPKVDTTMQIKPDTYPQVLGAGSLVKTRCTTTETGGEHCPVVKRKTGMEGTEITFLELIRHRLQAPITLHDGSTVPLETYLHRAAREAKVPDMLASALIYGLPAQESALDPRAHSSAGAQGIFQLLPSMRRQLLHQYAPYVHSLPRHRVSFQQLDIDLALRYFADRRAGMLTATPTLPHGSPHLHFKGRSPVCPPHTIRNFEDESRRLYFSLSKHFPFASQEVRTRDVLLRSWNAGRGRMLKVLWKIESLSTDPRFVEDVLYLLPSDDNGTIDPNAWRQLMIDLSAANAHKPGRDAGVGTDVRSYTARITALERLLQTSNEITQ